MKKITHLIPTVAIFLISTALYGQTSAPSKNDSGCVPLAVVKTNVRLRTHPIIEPDNILGMVNPGVLFIAEKWPLRDDDNKRSWYKIVGFLDKTTGCVTDRNAAGMCTPCYVSADLVKETSYAEIKLNEESVMQQLAQTPYGQGYSAVDASPAMQRKMAEQKILMQASLKSYDNQRFPVYAEPSKSSGEPKYTDLTKKEYYEYDIVVTDTTKPGWLFIVDLLSVSSPGWVETDWLRIGRSFDGRFEVGDLVALTLGANVPEIMRRWGPGQVVERWAGYSDITEMSFDGLKLRYEDYRNFEFTLTRKGAGMGGVFIGVPWCNKEYIEKTFGETLSIEKDTDAEGNEHWSLDFIPDGWYYWFSLTFDAQGLVSKFFYVCHDVDLS